MAVYIRTYDMEMPSPCPRCGEVYELDDLLVLPNSQELVCEDCWSIDD